MALPVPQDGSARIERKVYLFVPERSAKPALDIDMTRRFHRLMSVAAIAVGRVGQAATT